MPIAISEVKDSGTQAAMNRLQQDVRKYTPAIEFEYVDVTFNSSANVDTVISTRLRPANPEDVIYTVVGLDFLSNPATVPVIYKDTSTTRKPWGVGFIVLRSNVGSLVAHLKLEIKRT